MEKLANKLASNISTSLNYDNEKEQVVAYGLIAIIQTFTTVFLALIIGIFTGVPIEALILCFSVSILRKYSGGAHASTIELCTAIAVINIVAFSLISKYLLSDIITGYIMIALTLIVFILSYIAINRYAPVDSPNKPIKTEKKKMRMRKGSFITITIYLVISVIFILLSQKNLISYSLNLSLLFGVGWQIFTLTKTGSKFFNLINSAFNNIVIR